jgi:hypothetical protein
VGRIDSQRIEAEIARSLPAETEGVTHRVRPRIPGNKDQSPGIGEMSGELALCHLHVDIRVERRALDGDQAIEVGRHGRRYGKRHLFPLRPRRGPDKSNRPTTASEAGITVTPRQRSLRLRGGKMRR